MRIPVTFVLLLAGFATPAMAAERCAGPRWRTQDGLERLVYLGQEPETYRVCASGAGDRSRLFAMVDGARVGLPTGPDAWTCADLSGKQISIRSEGGDASGVFCRDPGPDAPVQAWRHSPRPAREAIVHRPRSKTVAARPAEARCFSFGGQRYCE
jgi:hypothetical protein